MKKDELKERYDELMHPMENRVFAALARIVQELADGEDLTRKELLHRLPYHAGETAANQEQALHFINTAFCFDDALTADDWEDTAFLPTANQIPLPWRLSFVEKRWLRTLVLSPDASFLLPEDLREKLKDALKDVPPLDLSFVRRSQLAGDDLTSPETLAVLQAVFACVRKKYTLLLPTQEQLAPLRIRYNFRTNRYSLIALPIGEKEASPIRLHVKDLIGAKLGLPRKEKDIIETEDVYQKYLDDHRVTIRLRLEDNRNARERCYALFASFDKTSIYLEKENAYRIDLSYYDFDHEDILSRLLSLGPVVTVLPQEGNEEAKRLRHDIVKALREALPYYQE